MRIGILQTGHAPDEIRGDLGDYADMFRHLLDGNGFDFRQWDVVDGVFPGGPQDADGWLITGSKHAAYEDHAWIAPLEALIRAIVAQDLPLVGICFGHQIIAQALGGTVEKFSGGWAVGRQIYDFEGEPLALNAWHQDQVVTLPKGARAVASNEFCKYAALMIGDKVFTVQPHPEFSADVIEGLIAYRGGAVPPEGIAAARAALPEETNNKALATRLADVLKKGAA